MSVHGKSASLEGATSKRLSIPEFAARKGAEPLVCLTAYTTPMAQRLDGHVDLLMVGDSLGMVLYGFDSTLPVTLDMMIQHGAAVCRGSRTSLVVVDMPFGSYQESPEQAFRSAARIMKETGCQAVKLEGGRDLADTVSFLVKRGVPVMASTRRRKLRLIRRPPPIPSTRVRPSAQKSVRWMIFARFRRSSTSRPTTRVAPSATVTWKARA